MELVLHTFTMMGEVPFPRDKFPEITPPKRIARRNYKELALELDDSSAIFQYSEMRGFEKGKYYHGIMRSNHFLDCIVENFYKTYEHSLFMHRVRILGNEDHAANAIITLDGLRQKVEIFKYAHASRNIDVRRDFDIREFTSIDNVLSNRPVEKSPDDFY